MKKNEPQSRRQLEADQEGVVVRQAKVAVEQEAEEEAVEHKKKQQETLTIQMTCMVMETMKNTSGFSLIMS